MIYNFNRRSLLELCINAVRAELQAESYEIIVVDGSSSNDSVEWLTEQKDIISIIQHNYGEWNGKPIEHKPWTYFMNLAFKCASGKYICMLSGDSLVVPGAILNGADLFDEALAQGVKLGGVAFYFRDYPVRKQYATEINVGNLCIKHGLYLNEAVQEVGYYDEEYHSYFSDTDLCLKIKASGYKITSSKTSFVEHYFEAKPQARSDSNDEKKAMDRLRLIKKWAGKAYPAEKEQDYMRVIGYWNNHLQGFFDQHHTIQKLVSASDASYVDLPKITVVTVVFQDPKGLNRTIQSVLEQTYPSVEYLVIDGGSQDATQDVLSQYQERVDVIVSEPDGGIYDAMNKGLALANGDYIIFMNSDDVFTDTGVLEKIVCDLDGSDVVYGHRNYVDENGTVSLQKCHDIEYVKYRMPYCHQSAFYRVDTLRKMPFNTTYKYSADYNQIIEIFKSGGRFKRIDTIICNYAAGGKSESGLRPYLEVLKIQFDNFGDGENMKKSVYMRGFIRTSGDLLRKYTDKPKDQKSQAVIEALK